MLSEYLKKKLILGTASFKSNYGIDKNSNLSDKELTRLFKICFKEKIIYLDTSNRYNLKNFSKLNKNLKKFRIIYKINLNLNKVKTYNQIKKEVYSLLNNFLKKNKIKRLYCVMLHSENLMLNKNKGRLFSVLKKIKDQKTSEKIGISGYNLENIINIIKKFNFDIIQFPYNLFDQRIADFKVLKLLKKKKIELHIRSIFLQGIFFIKEDEMPDYFNKWKKQFNRLKNILEKRKINILSVCLSHAFNLSFKNKKIVIGIKSLEHLDEIFKTNINKKTKFVRNLRYSDKNLILPHLWKTKIK